MCKQLVEETVQRRWCQLLEESQAQWSWELVALVQQGLMDLELVEYCPVELGWRRESSLRSVCRW